MEDDSARTVTDLSPVVSRRAGIAVLAGTWDAQASTLERRRRGRTLLGEAAVRLWGASADPVVTARCRRCGGDHGRPEVVDRRTGLRLPGSVTHAGSTTLVALGPAAVGIDAEPLEGDPARYAAIREVSGRNAATAADGLEALRVWTTIEAVLKADGRGLEVDPRRVRIDGAPGSPGSTARVDDGPVLGLWGVSADGLVVTVAAPRR